MGHLPHITSPEMAGSPSARHYNELIEQSVRARRRGDHWTAQQLASEAHRFAMDELNRMQRLAIAEDALAQATRQLETAWDKDRECATIEELQECHPEFKRVITAWENAKQQVRDLSAPQLDETETLKQSRGAW